VAEVQFFAGMSAMIELTPQQQQFVDSQIALGLFKEPTEVVGVALGLLQQRQDEYRQLSRAVGQVERGEYELLDIEDIKRRGRERKAPP
jgi:Arc/MetJ-type ribon-helix-helix transcriptional regulator